MKITLVFSLLFALLLFISNASAKNVEFLADGSYKLLETTPQYAEIIQYDREWKDAVTRPGHLVSAESHPLYGEMIDLFHQKSTRVIKTGLYFYRKTGDVSIVRGSTIPEPNRFNPYLLFWIASVVGVTLMHYLFLHTRLPRRSPDFFTVGFLSAVCALGAALYAEAFPIVSVAAYLAAFAIPVTLLFFNEKLRKMLWGLTYVSMATSLAAFLAISV